MRFFKYLLGFFVALAVFVISALLLATFIPDQGFGGTVVLVVAVVRIALALVLAVMAFRAVVKS